MDFGTFHLGHPIYLDNWDRKQGMASFQAIELDPQNPKFKKNRRLVVTHSVLLQLEVSSQFPGIGHLVSWATLQALSNIKRSKADPSKLTFQWKQMGSSPPFSQLFQVTDADSCIDLISRNMNRMGAIVKRQNPMPNLKEEEVTSKSLRRTKIDEILQSIAVYESNLETNLNIDMINSLMSLYQQAIEYYSALNDDRFQDFIMRLHKMLRNEIIQTVLQSQHEVSAKPKATESHEEEVKVEAKKEDIKVEEVKVEVKREGIRVEEVNLEPKKEEIKVQDDKQEEKEPEILEVPNSENAIEEVKVEPVEVPKPPAPAEEEKLEEAKEEIPEEPKEEEKSQEVNSSEGIENSVESAPLEGEGSENKSEDAN